MGARVSDRRLYPAVPRMLSRLVQAALLAEPGIYVAFGASRGWSVAEIAVLSVVAALGVRLVLVCATRVHEGGLGTPRG